MRWVFEGLVPRRRTDVDDYSGAFVAFYWQELVEGRQGAQPFFPWREKGYIREVTTSREEHEGRN